MITMAVSAKPFARRARLRERSALKTKWDRFVITGYRVSQRERSGIFARRGTPAWASINYAAVVRRWNAMPKLAGASVVNFPGLIFPLFNPRNRRAAVRCGSVRRARRFSLRRSTGVLRVCVRVTRPTMGVGISTRAALSREKSLTKTKNREQSDRAWRRDNAPLPRHRVVHACLHTWNARLNVRESAHVFAGDLVHVRHG